METKRKKEQDKQKLEHLLKERTKEINEKNQQLEHQIVKLRMQFEKLKEIDKVKSRFFANISHELRTPLTLIMAMLEEMLSQIKDNEQKNKMDLIFKNSRQMLNLINQLLDLSRFDSDKMKLHAAHQNIVLFLKYTVEPFRFLALKNQLEMEFHPEDEEINLYFDFQKMEEAINNLLINAIKFTPANGKITVSVSVDKDNQQYIQNLQGEEGVGPVFVKISVRDTGIGIPQNQLPHIFDRFYQPEGKGPWEETLKGTGLGLSLTNEIILMHHGKIDVHSQEGKGMEFIIRLPMGNEHLESDEIISRPGIASDIEISKEMEKHHIPPGKNKEIDKNGIYPGEIPLFNTLGAGLEYFPKETAFEGVNIAMGFEFDILLVDDNPLIRKFIRRFLNFGNYKIIEASSGYEALNILESSQTIDLILLDIMMSGMSGYEVLEKIRERFPANKLSVIVLTAKSHPVDLVTAFKLGANDFIVKPVSKAELLARIQTQLSLIKLQKQLIMSEKMVSLGMLLAGFAHEINNPVASIKMNSEFFTDAWKDIEPLLDRHAQKDDDFKIGNLPYKSSKKEIKKMIMDLLKDTWYIQGIVDELNAFRMEEDLTKSWVDINDVIKAAISITQNMINQTAPHFSVELESGIPPLLGIFQGLERVFANLIKNSCQALTDNSQGIDISSTYLKNSKQILVKVKDDGIGIEEKHLKNIVDPFFTTKEDKGGRGMGLYISSRIVQFHGGFINFESKLGSGTTVFVFLPVEPMKAEKEKGG
jgi:signal transduction histidine kinase